MKHGIYSLFVLEFHALEKSFTGIKRYTINNDGGTGEIAQNAPFLLYLPNANTLHGWV
jgi:hypothetical protein